MSTTALTWALVASGLFVLSFARPVWAVALYFQTFFAFPLMWWWGDELPGLRYPFLAGIVLLGAVLWYRMRSGDDSNHRFTFVHVGALALVVNATFVQLVLAPPSLNPNDYIELVKYVLLFFLIWGAIQDRRDYRLVLVAIAIGASYIGYEATINERGDFNGSRLEGLGAPGADTANSLADVMLVALPLIGGLFASGTKREKLIVLLSAPLALNVLILCNSRGAFLGLAGAGLTFLLIARGATRKKAIRAMLLGSVALYLLLGDPEILNRFSTTFVGSEQRDNSAASRLEFWRAGLRMIADHPFGAGGGSFKYVYGARYLTVVTGQDAESRSLHNGYLTETTDWGIQGLILKMLFFGAAIAAAFRTTTRCRLDNRIEDALMGICVLVAALGFLIHCMFGSFLGNEWGYWIVALLVRYHEVYQMPQMPSAATAPEASNLQTPQAAA